MNSARPWRIVALLAVLALALAACPDDVDAPDVTNGETGDLELVNEGQLTVCSDIPYPPFEFVDDDGEYAGFDIDLMREIAAGLGLELNVRETPWEGIFAAVEIGDCDVVASAVSITEERQERMDFTDPYFDADQSLLIREEDADRFRTLEDLAGETIGVQTGTTGADYAEENAPDGATIREYDDAGAMFVALENRDVAAILQDYAVNADRAQAVDGLTVTERFPTGEEYGFVVRQGNDALREALNEQLARVRTDGAYDEVFARYFGEAP